MILLFLVLYTLGIPVFLVVGGMVSKGLEDQLFGPSRKVALGFLGLIWPLPATVFLLEKVCVIFVDYGIYLRKTLS